MSRPLTREEAARTLGLSTTSGPQEIKQAYRRMAREHHPDRGGDPYAFHELRSAYERLVHDDAPAPPAVARGRPSRDVEPTGGEPADVELDRIVWDPELPARRVRLDAGRTMAWLADVPPDSRAPVRPLTATSRSPGSRFNRLAYVLADELTARLHVAGTTDDRGEVVVGIEVAGRARRARRSLDRVALGGGWIRTRGATSTRLRTHLVPSQDRRATAVRSTERLAALLDELRWPLPHWTMERSDTAPR